MVKMLGNSRSHQASGSKASLSQEEVTRQLTDLSEQRKSWRASSKEYKTAQSDWHWRILQRG